MPNAVYCSELCRGRSAYKRGRFEKTCPQCGIVFLARDKRAKFCSKSHAATFNNPKAKRKNREISDCLNCNKPLNSNQKKYCSYICSGAHKKFSVVEKWLKEEITATTVSGNLTSWARNYMLNEAENKCTKCGWCEPNELLGRPILTIDHIDGNWKNNSRDNLVVLCYNCHTLTSTFGALNVGNISGRRPGIGNRRNNSI